LNIEDFGVHEKAPEVVRAEHGYGLRKDALSPLEVLAQSVSLIAPCTTPSLTVPLVFALAGNASWLAYALAMTAMILVSFPIALFARSSASPGSLYVYTRDNLPPWVGSVAALALLFAYVCTASSVIGGFINSCQIFLGSAGWHVPGALLAVVAAVGALAVAFADVSLSARVMLWIELVSVALIGLVVVLVLARHGVHVDAAQVHMVGGSAVGVRLGVMLAIFSFVGFESATTLGAEAQRPLVTIPRAVVMSAAAAGVFFVVCTYAEVMAFRGSGMPLGESTSPFRYMAGLAHVGYVGPLIDAGVLVSMFAATLACVIAAARVLLLLSHEGLAHKALQRTHAKSESPAVAGAVAAVLAVVPAAMLAARGASGADIYGWMGTLAVYAFLTAYGLVVVAAVVFAKRRSELTVGRALVAGLAALAMLAGMVGSLYPVPPAPYRYLPWVYVAYVAMGLVWLWMARRNSATGNQLV
jgi:amino acid transporter